MIRGIFIASLMFFHLALAQQAPSGVPATCNISPNPGENSQNKSLIASQMRTRGLANPTEAQVRCIMNAPRDGRLAKLKEMIDAQQGQQAMPPKPAVPAPSAPQYPDISFGSGGVPLTKTPLEDDHIMACSPANICIAIQFDRAQISNAFTMNKPTLKCNAGNTCTLIGTGVTQRPPQKIKYKIQGAYTIEDATPTQQVLPQPMPAPGGNPQQGGGQVANSLPQTFSSKELIGILQATDNRDILVLAKPLAGTDIKNIAIRMPENKQGDLRGRELRFLQCENCTFTLVREKTKFFPYHLYDISGTYSFQVELPPNAPVAVTPPTAGPVNNDPKNTTYPQEIAFPKEALIHIQKSNSETQVFANPAVKPLNFAGQMMIELNKEMVKNLPQTVVTLKCTTESCTLAGSGIFAGPPEMPVYKISAGNFEIASAPTPQLVPAPAPLPIALPADITTKEVIKLQRTNQFLIIYHAVSGDDIVVRTNIQVPESLNGRVIKIKKKTYFDLIQKSSSDLVVGCLDNSCAIKCDYPASKSDQCGQYGEYYLDGNYDIKENPINKKEIEFKKGQTLYVTFKRQGFEDPPTNKKPQYYVAYNNLLLQISESNMQNPGFFVRNPSMLSETAVFNMTCESYQCFTLKPNSGNNYREVEGKFTLRLNY